MDMPIVSPEPSIDSLLFTFRYMTHRKLRRRAHGQYKKHSSRRWVLSAIVIALFMSLVGIGAQKIELATSWPELALVVLLLVAMVYIVVKVSMIIRWCFYWLALATLVLFAVNKGITYTQFTDPTIDPTASYKAKVVLIVLACVEAVTVGTVFVNRVVYPRIVLRAKWLNVRKWWRIKPAKFDHARVPQSANYKSVSFSYKSWDGDDYKLTRGIVTYTGEFDDEGRPHGLGEYSDHSFAGEALQGMWDHGIPIGPFKSQEYGTGNTFSCIRIGFCKNSMDKNEATVYGAMHDPRGISYGAASVECSVSGKFFKHLPHVRVVGFNQYRSAIVEQAANDLEAPITALSYPLSFLSTYTESLQSRPSIHGSFSGTAKGTPLPKSVVIRYTDRGIFIPGFVRSRRAKGDINQVQVKRMCPPSEGVEGHTGPVSVSVTEAQGAVGSSTGKSPHLSPIPSYQGTFPGSPKGNESDGDSDNGKGTRRSMDRERNRRNNQSGLVIEGWRQVIDMDGVSPSDGGAPDRAGYEALIFVHGYNCPLTYALARLGQLLSLGEFPPYIKPFVYSWPSSITMGYFKAKKVGCSDDVSNDFRRFLSDLRDAGFTRVHILAHSMGARIVLAALRKGCLDGIVAEREVEDIVEESSTGISMDPSEPRSAGLSDSATHLSGLRPRPTIRYRDQGQFTRQETKASLTSNGEQKAPIQLATFTFLNPDADLKDFIDDDYWILSKFCPHISLYADAGDGALFWSEVLGRKPSLGRHPNTLIYTPTGEILDVDVIDTTYLDVNIHSLRHNFFNLNRMLVDDLYDSIVLGRRARERVGRLSPRWSFSETEGIENGATYMFLCAPFYVVNK